jgi:hypothetical protein
MSNVVSLEPKSVSGRARNCAWSYNYNRDTRTWTWRVEVALAPQVFTGSAASEREAKEAIYAITHSKKVPNRS